MHKACCASATIMSAAAQLFCARRAITPSKVFSPNAVICHIVRAAARPARSRPAAPDVSKPARDGSVAFEGVRLTPPDRVLYPEDGITKLDLARYYAAVCEWALPQLSGRPLTLVRCPGGQGKPGFY